MSVIDHIWLDPKCDEEGCQSLVWKERAERAEAERDRLTAEVADAASALPFVAGSIENRIRVYRDEMQRRVAAANARAEAAEKVIVNAAKEIQSSWYEADNFAEAQRGARHCKRILDAALSAAQEKPK